MGRALLLAAVVCLRNLRSVLFDRARYIPDEPAGDVAWPLVYVAAGDNGSRLERFDVGHKVLLSVRPQEHKLNFL